MSSPLFLKKIFNKEFASRKSLKISEGEKRDSETFQEKIKPKKSIENKKKKGKLLLIKIKVRKSHFAKGNPRGMKTMPGIGL